MRSIATFEGLRSSWIQPKAFERRFELRSGDALLGSLTFRSSFGTLAVAETADGSWSFKRVGFMNPRITVRDAGAQDELAIYHPRMWGDGHLTFMDGADFVWKPTNFWATSWVFADAADNALVGMTAGLDQERLSDMFRTQSTLEVRPGAGRSERLPILATLAIYLMILRQQDVAASGGAVAAVM